MGYSICLCRSFWTGPIVDGFVPRDDHAKGTVDGRKKQTTSIDILFDRIEQGVNYMTYIRPVILCMLSAPAQHDPHRKLTSSLAFVTHVVCVVWFLLPLSSRLKY